MKTLVFTGHRPDKLGGVYDQDAPIYYQIGTALRQYVLKYSGIVKDHVHLVDGGALGGDRTFERVAVKLKQQYPKWYTNEIAVPCANHDSRWTNDSKILYHQMLQMANKVTIVSNAQYSPELMQIRNVYMVNMADQIVALWNGTPGGTYNAIKYALSLNKPVHVIDPRDFHEYDITNNDLEDVVQTAVDNRKLTNDQIKGRFSGIKVYLQTDGSCQPNPGPGGWSAKIQFNLKGKDHNDHVVFTDGYSLNATNNQMEMSAILAGMVKITQIPELSGKNLLVTVRSDSRYCINALDSWMNNWKNNAVDGPDGRKIWKTASKDPVENQEMWEAIDAVREKFTCIYEYIPREKNFELDGRAKAQTQIAKGLLAQAINTINNQEGNKND